MKSIFSAGRKMPAQMVGLLDTLCPSQDIYLIDHYCFRKVVPKVHQITKMDYFVGVNSVHASGSSTNTLSTSAPLDLRALLSLTDLKWPMSVSCNHCVHPILQ